MLKLLVRFSAVACVAFLAILSAVFVTAEESDGLPDSNFSISLDFDGSQASKVEIVDALNKYVDQHKVRVVRMLADPDDFLTNRLAYEFGSAAAGREARPIELFTPGMTGTLTSAKELGVGSLDGSYSFYGAQDEVDAFTVWIQTEFGATTWIGARTPEAVLGYALFSTGAWLPTVATVFLLAATVTGWYVLRARSRELRILGGMRLAGVVGGDLFSLLRALAVPAISTAIVGVAAVFFIAGGRMSRYLEVLAVSILITVMLITLAGLLTSSLTLPTARGIAARLPPERASWQLTEVIKIVSLVLAATMLPTVISTMSRAVEAASAGDVWDAVDDTVALRLASESEKQFQEEDLPQIMKLTAAADVNSTVMLSASLTNANLFVLNTEEQRALVQAGFDGVIIVNDSYVSLLAPYLGISPTDANPLGPNATPFARADLPAPAADSLLGSLGLWLAPGYEADDALDWYAYEGRTPFPAFTSISGNIVSFSSPLVIYTDELSEVFKPGFIGALMTSGQVAFTDPVWLGEHIEADLVLSIDRVADRGLDETQRHQQLAQLTLLSLVLVVIGLVMMIAVSSWIFSLTHRRRIFVERTAGRSWLNILQRRFTWEAVVLLVITGALTIALVVNKLDYGWITLAVVPGYAVVSYALHRWSASQVFRSTLARRS